MPRVEITLPEELYAEFERAIEEEFMNRDEAIEELLSAGIDAYRPGSEEPNPEAEFAEEFADEMWDTADDPMADDDSI